MSHSPIAVNCQKLMLISSVYCGGCAEIIRSIQALILKVCDLGIKTEHHKRGFMTFQSVKRCCYTAKNICGLAVSILSDAPKL